MARKVWFEWRGHENQKSQQPHPARRRIEWHVRANEKSRNGVVAQYGNSIDRRAQKRFPAVFLTRKCPK